jgi:hypothetical protein
MAGILTIGGPDQVKIEQIFPSTQKTFSYNFGQNITGWTFLVDYHTIVIDTIYFDRSGVPSFDNSIVIGYFPKVTVTSPYLPAVVNASTGAVTIFIPGGMYTGPIIPDARQDVPVTVVGVTWTDNNTPAQINTHRWAFIQNWEPGVTVGDPKLEATFVSITLG